jgi:hypothetical protein
VSERNLPTTHGRAYHFFAATSFITSISRSRSAIIAQNGEKAVDGRQWKNVPATKTSPYAL